tara:strand:- start:33095 stop:33205 length:111 start_codon:yes stop_codon:yes gene_type:complete
MVLPLDLEMMAFISNGEMPSSYLLQMALRLDVFIIT